MNHHLKQYPSHDFISDKYRSAGNDSSLFLFSIVFAPFVILALILTITQTISLLLGITILFEMAVIGFLNNSLHDSFHIRNTVWERFNFFKKLREKHITHHIDLSKNLGIFIFIWDRLFNTFSK